MTSSKTVVLYTRVGCHLCDDAKDVIDGVRVDRAFELEIIDVDTDPALAAAYGLEVPVIAIDGRKAFKFRVTAEALRQRLDRPD